MFHRGNIGKKGFAAAADSKLPADAWESPKAVLDIQWALANLAEVMAQLWPLDGSIRIIQRVLIRYDYGAAYGASEKDRCRILEEFCDRTLCENASRAARGDPYLSFDQVKNRWRDAVEQEAPAKTTSNPASQQTNYTAANNKTNTAVASPWVRGGRGGSRGGGMANRGGIRGGWQARGAAAMFQGNPVCYHFNSRPAIGGAASGCTRQPAGAGCDNGQGGIYAHVCNFNLGNGQFCLQAHPRVGNH